MSKPWVINPEVDTVTNLALVGRFLENDYRMAIEHLSIPSSFDEYTEKSGRRFVIVGAKSVPAATAKSVFLCLKLAGPNSVIVKAPTLDEALLVQNVLDVHGEGIRTKVYTESSDFLKLSTEWRDELENATDIVVFGDQSTMLAFRDLETVERRVWEHGPKFSFGLVRASQLTTSLVGEICFDFFSFYGEGCLSPKFYFVVGKVTEQGLKEFSACMSTYYGGAIEEFRAKLPLTRKSELVQQYIDANLVAKYLRVEELDSPEMFSTLYGDVRLVFVDNMDQVEDFVAKWHDRISSVAVNTLDDEDAVELFESHQVNRICEIGTMQFPEFFEQFDNVDDFIIYAEEE